MIFICAFVNVYLRCILIWPPRAFHSATVERDRCKDVRSWIARTFSSALCCQDTGNNCNMGIRISFFFSFFFPLSRTICYIGNTEYLLQQLFFSLPNCTRFFSYFKCGPNAFCRPLRVMEMPPYSLRVAVDGCSLSGSFGGTAAAKLCVRCSHIPTKSQNRTVRISRFLFGFLLP